MYGSIDLVTDKIERQIRKNKTKIERKNKNKVATSQLFTDALVEDPNVVQSRVVRSKQIDLKTNGFGRSYSTNGFVGT